jgi:hypothetical protein
MGILAGFVGGAARATGEIANQRIARYTAEELQRQRDQMDQERDKRIEEAQIARENRAVAQREKDRTDTIGRIDAEAGRIAESTVAAKRGLIDQGIVDKTSWTPEQQAVVEQSLASDRQSISADVETKYKASVNTGDTSMQNAALMEKQERRLDQQDKKNDAQTEFNNRRLTMQDEWNKRQDAIRNRLADIQEGRANRAEKKYDTQMEKAELNSTRLSLQSVLKDIATQEDKLQFQMANQNISPEQQKIIVSKMEALDEDRINARNYLLELGGIKKDKAAPKDDPFASAFAEKLKEVQGAKKSQGQSQSNPATASPTGLIDSPRAKIDTAARDADIARMNTLSGSSNNRSTIITKKEEEISSNLQDKISQIQRGMSRDEKFKLFTWCDENGGYMTPAQLKQVRDAKLKAGM